MHNKVTSTVAPKMDVTFKWNTFTDGKYFTEWKKKKNFRVFENLETEFYLTYRNPFFIIKTECREGKWNWLLNI